MASDETNQNPLPQPLQFDTAEPAGNGTTAAVECSACNAAIATSYYEADGAIVCMSCRAKLMVQLTGGSGSARFGKAVGLGLLAAAAGSALYYGILAATGYEIGLVAIAVGFLVGAAVKRGSGGRGGRSYQMLAVGLTYFAIVTTYIPFIMKAIHENPPTVGADSTAQVAAAATDTGLASASAELQGGAMATPPSTSAAPVAKQFSIVHLLLAVGALLAMAALAPFLAGFQNIIGLAIIGFALFEAWRLNQRVQIAVTGPYRVGAKRDEQPSAEAAGG